MADEKLTQKAKDHVQQAGDNAQQIQAGTVIINNGINEVQARELYSEMSKKAMKEYTAESHSLIEKRITDFANILIPRIEKIENGLEAFADPEFQVELKKLKFLLHVQIKKLIMKCSRNCSCTGLRIRIIAEQRQVLLRQ